MKDESVLPTSEEITRRLRTVSELRNLCLSLGRAKRLTDESQTVRIETDPPAASRALRFVGQRAPLP